MNSDSNAPYLPARTGWSPEHAYAKLEEQGDTMATVEQTYLRSELVKRRERLQSALSSPAADASLTRLLNEVDSALGQMDHGTYGLCEECHETIEADRLLADPLVRFCLDHLTYEERRALEGDLGLAARIQRGLLPRPETRAAGWEARYHYEPLGLVSGDYCDLIEAEGALNFVVGDVAGKGVAASMLMSHLHATFRSLIGVGLSLAHMLEAANRVFCESTMAGQYATLVFGRAAASGELELVSAGHCPVLVARGQSVERLDATGVPLGMFCNSHYCSHRTRFDPGNRLVVYTDGLSESQNSAGEEYGVERISERVGKGHRLALETLLVGCLADVRGFAGAAPRTDDLTMLVLQRAA